MWREPDFSDIEAAARRLAGRIHRTPLLRHPFLDEAAGTEVLLKAEPLQRTGSFKIRGALNTLLAAAERDGLPPRVIAYSSGNHAQAVAAAAVSLGLPATIVMPSDAPEIKRRLTARYRAEIVLYDRQRESREAIAQRLREEGGGLIVPPFDHPDIIAGQGTLGLEIAAETKAQPPSVALVPAGGGGLIAGTALALREAFPGIAVYAVEPEGADDWARSLAAGERLANDPLPQGICDALFAPMPGELTFALNRRLLAGGVVVTEAEVLSAMRFAFTHLKLVIEPGGAVALAAVLARKLPLAGRRVVVVASGGNVDPALFARALEQGSEA